MLTMKAGLKDIVYAQNVVAFVTVANEYCTFAEHAGDVEKIDFVNASLNLMSLLYLRAHHLAEVEILNEEDNEKFVTEFDWLFVRNGIAQVLGDHDVYLDYFDNYMNETPEPVAASVSENMADVYQDLKDFLEIYKLGNVELSNDALAECRSNFVEYTGFRIVNAIKILHQIKYKITHSESAATHGGNPLKRDTDNWFLSKAQQQFRNDD